VNPAAFALLHFGAAALCALSGIVALWVSRGPTGIALGVSALIAAAWAVAAAMEVESGQQGLVLLLEVIRNAVWLATLILLYRWLAGATARSLVRRFALAGSALVMVALLAVMPRAGLAALPDFGPWALLARISLDILIVVMAENLIRNADRDALWHVNLPCIALGGLTSFDLVTFAHSALSGYESDALQNARAVLLGLAMPLLAIAAVRDRRSRRGTRTPRRVIFRGAALILCGSFLLGVGAAGELLRHLEISWGSTAQVSMLAGALMAAAVVAASGSARSRLRNVIVDQFFTARHDYRREWLRCIATLSAPEDGSHDPHLRAIRVIADAADSPAGILLLRDDTLHTPATSARLRWVASWNLPPLPDVPVEAALPWLAASGRITALDARTTPAPLVAAAGPLWLAVPLVHHGEGAAGLVLLAAPRAPVTLDRETDELLRTLGRAVAMYLAERRAAERLAEGRRVQDYAKHFAFVAHDVKTVSSQLELLLANAEEHIHDPEFQHDMLVTVRASAARIKALIARLGQPGEEPRTTQARAGDGIAPAPAIATLEALHGIAARQAHPVRIEAPEGPDGPAAPLVAAMHPESFEAAVTHLVNNAAEASPPGQPVRVRLAADQGQIFIDVMDRGPGMSAAFIRDTLFNPLATSKPGGSGIGAWQARELAREAGGDVTVSSAPGMGTTMRLMLPARLDGG
jgi:putative PEP-CTERM system histidine kinase